MALLQDLFYRLSVFPIHLRSLRERPEDIPVLAEYFLQRAAPRLGRRFSGIHAVSMRRMQQYHWPGNIRQLQNVIEQSAILCDGGKLEVADTAVSGRARSRSRNAPPGSSSCASTRVWIGSARIPATRPCYGGWGSMPSEAGAFASLQVTTRFSCRRNN